MSAVPLSETAAKRRIGDILLAHGFVTAEELADAVLEQERTQQPLGQILVGRGAITRLELASALAEQWSDPAASITSNTRSAPSAPAAPAPSAQDEAQYAARLQEAVADLARKVQSNKPLEGIDERVEELSRRIESTLARTQHIEAAVATLAESLEGVTTGVEEAFYALQTGTADLVSDLARIEQTVGEIAAREVPQGNDTALADLHELQAAVAELSDGSAVTVQLRENVDELTARLAETAVPVAAVEDLSRRLDDVAEQLDSLRSMANLDELASTVHDLESRSASFAGIAERLDRIESESAGEQLRTDVEVHARLLAELETVVDDLRERPAGTPDVDERLTRLEAHFEDAAGARVELTTRIDELAGRLSEQTAADPRVEGVLAQLTLIEARIEENLSEMEGVKDALARHDEAGFDVRLADLAQTLEVVRGEIADVAASTVSGADTGERLDSLVTSVEMLAEQNDEARALAARFDALAARLADGVVTPDELARTVEGLARDDDAKAELAARLGAVEGSLADGVVTPEELTRTIEEALSEQAAPVVDERVSDLAADVAALRAEFASLDRGDEANRLTWVEARLETLSRNTKEDGLLSARLEELEKARISDADTVNILAVAMDRIRHDLTTALSADGPVPSDVLEAVQALGERLAALEDVSAAVEAPVHDDSELAAELERVRLVIERVGLHLAEHDRSIADLAPSRGVEERLQELTVLVQDLAESQQNASAHQSAGEAPPIPGDIGSLLKRVEEAEMASQSDSEKLINRLERMASSIDWRLQRLESDAPDESA